NEVSIYRTRQSESVTAMIWKELKNWHRWSKISLAPQTSSSKWLVQSSGHTPVQEPLHSFSPIKALTLLNSRTPAIDKWVRLSTDTLTHYFFVYREGYSRL